MRMLNAGGTQQVVPPLCHVVILAKSGMVELCNAKVFCFLTNNDDLYLETTALLCLFLKGRIREIQEGYHLRQHELSLY